MKGIFELNFRGRIKAVALMLLMVMLLTSGIGCQPTEAPEEQVMQEVLEPEETTGAEDALQEETGWLEARDDYDESETSGDAQQDQEEKTSPGTESTTEDASQVPEESHQEGMSNKPEASAPAPTVEETLVTEAEPDSLLITGTALTNDLVLNPSQWQFNQQEFVQRFYSSNNNLGFHKIWLVKGYDLLGLFQQAGLTEGDHPVTFESSDGLTFTMNLSDLLNRFYYSDLTPDNGEAVRPMVGFFRKELFDAIEPETPVTWQVGSLTPADADPQWPRLYMGQQPDNPADVNQPFFVRELVRIVVGEER